MSVKKKKGQILSGTKGKRTGGQLLAAAIVLTMAAGCSGAGRTDSDIASGDDKARPVQEQAEEVNNTDPLTEQTFQASRDILKEAGDEFHGGRRTEMEKGYRLPLDDAVKEEAETDCKAAMEKIGAIYREANKGDTLNPILSGDAISQMYTALQENGFPVIAAGYYYRMGNYEKVDAFLTGCQKGEAGSVTLYKINTGGGINRSQFMFDGTKMYVVDTAASWNQNEQPHVTSSTHTRLKSWKYTPKGWFAYEYSVPEFPEVTEIVNGNYMIRVRPMAEEYIKLAENYLLPIGYQGNNLFRTNWGAGHMEELDYNGLYEYLYEIRHQEAFGPQRNLDGIPKEEFENMMTAYLPVTAAELSRYAVFDEGKGEYVWKRLGPLTYKANNFSSSIPEVVQTEENPDGTISVSIDVVCIPRGEDALMRHVLTLELPDNGGVRFLGNQVTEEAPGEITEYHYRLREHP